MLQNIIEYYTRTGFLILPRDKRVKLIEIEDLFPTMFSATHL